MSSEQTQQRRRGAVFYLLPNAFTTGALFAGFYAIIAALGDKPVAASIAVIIAGLLDGVDGRVARLTNSQSEFGVHYDSMSDLVSFGVAPALLAYTWSLQSLQTVSPMAGKLGWTAAFIYTACAALRLARFNAQVAVSDKRYFQGLASPAAAGTLVATVWFCTDNGISGSQVSWLMLLLTPALGLLMFSQLRYFSFKAWPNTERGPLTWALLLVLLFALLAVDPPLVLLIVGGAYVMSGVLLTLKGRRRRERR
ncbi:MAG: CDP-diacylglycerol--serine O-phosphatidyltransferase [Wenzhouxiangellaceae bacterium]